MKRPLTLCLTALLLWAPAVYAHGNIPSLDACDEAIHRHAPISDA